MASFSSSSVFTVVLLLLSIVLVSASTDRKNVFASISPSLEKTSLTVTGICDPKDVSSDQTWGPTQDCNICSYYCTGVCAGMGIPMVKKACTPDSQKSQIFCQCCCEKPPSPPPPPPSPPPPSFPPPPTPSGGGQCGQPGDTSTETTMPTSNCADCTNWCKEECSDLGGYVVDDQCAIGESKFIRRCKCCCRENSTPPPPSCPPTQRCPSDVTWTIPGVSPCKYKLQPSLSSSSSSSVSM